jgi:hypothetical protein
MRGPKCRPSLAITRKDLIVEILRLGFPEIGMNAFRGVNDLRLRNRPQYRHRFAIPIRTKSARQRSG